MKLNNKQSMAILCQLINNGLLRPDNIPMCSTELAELFDDEIKEVRCISRFGMAGKLWNNDGRIYVSGHNSSEIGPVLYKEEQEIIKDINGQIAKLIEYYK